MFAFGCFILTQCYRNIDPMIPILMPLHFFLTSALLGRKEQYMGILFSNAVMWLAYSMSYRCVDLYDFI